MLVMGPDCGTAVVGGLGLGFANALRPGPVGIVAASGTGAQQVSCLLDAAGVGVTAVLGVGGRDLSAAVGGRSTLAAMELLDEAPGTELVVVLSKPPDPKVAEQVRIAAAALDTPVARRLRRDAARRDLTATTAKVLVALGYGAGAGGEWPAPYERSRAPAGIRARAVLRRDAVRRVDGDRGRSRSGRSRRTRRSNRSGRSARTSAGRGIS